MAANAIAVLALADRLLKMLDFTSSSLPILAGGLNEISVGRRSDHVGVSIKAVFT